MQSSKQLAKKDTLSFWNYLQEQCFWDSGLWLFIFVIMQKKEKTFTNYYSLLNLLLLPLSLCSGTLSEMNTLSSWLTYGGGLVVSREGEEWFDCQVYSYLLLCHLRCWWACKFSVKKKKKLFLDIFKWLHSIEALLKYIWLSKGKLFNMYSLAYMGIYPLNDYHNRVLCICLVQLPFL